MLKFKPVPHVFLASITGLFLARDHLCSSGLHPNVRFFNTRRYLGKKTKRWIQRLKAIKCYGATVPVLLKCTDMYSALLREGR